jgi:hypothetical protein
MFDAFGQLFNAYYASNVGDIRRVALNPPRSLPLRELCFQKPQTCVTPFGVTPIGIPNGPALAYYAI